MIGALILAMAAQAEAADSTPIYEARTFEQALQTFERICVALLPSPRRFTDAMNASGVRWQRVARTPTEIWGSGNIWRSSLGQITYLHNQDIQHVIGGPACHLEFRTDPFYRHADAAAAVERLLALPAGRNTGNAREPQMRWEMRRTDGMSIRVFLSSNVAVPGGTGARLSISRRDTTPVPREEAAR